MHNKKILCLLSVLALMVVGCGNKDSSSSISNSSSSNTSSSSTSSSSSSSSSTSASSTSSISSSTSSSSSSSVEPIEHQDAFVSALADGAVTRNFNSSYDKMIDDFSTDTLAGTNNNGIASNYSTLRALVDNTSTSWPGSPDASIYKMATGSYMIPNYEGIGFRMRVTSGIIDYSNLTLALRGDDSYKTYDISLSDALNVDGEALPTLTSEYQDVIISPNLSIEDDQTVYELASGGLSDVTVLSTIIGFHLYAKGECSAIIEISDVFLYNAGETTILDTFDREAVNKTDASCWWRDSTGFIIPKNITLNGNASYKTANDAEVATYANLVLTLCGDTTGTSITPVYTTGEGAAISWANLKNPEGEAVVPAVNGAFHSLVINYEYSGINTENLVGFKVSSSSELAVSRIFVTNMQEKEAAVNYPVLDTANAVVFDSFTRTQAKLDTTYDASSTNQIILDAGLYYSIAYHGEDYMSVDGDKLKFVGGDYDYAQLAEGSSFAATTQKYLVFVMKGNDLSNFRINSNDTGVVYANNWFAGAGLPSIPQNMEDYPYQTADGFVYYIIDLEETGITAGDKIDMYYSGTQDLEIDSIFFANEYENIVAKKLSDGATVTIANGYSYGCGMDNVNTDKIAIKIKGDGTINLASLRIEYNGQTIYASSLVIKTADGTVVDPTVALPTEETTMIIDLVASGFTVESSSMHFHFGDENTSGIIVISEISALVVEPYAKKLSDGATVTIANGYSYGCGMDNVNTDKIAIKIKGDGTINLASLRIEYNGQTIYASSLVIKTADGTVVDPTVALPTEETTMIIDLVASGYTIGTSNMHFHFGDENTSGIIVISEISALYDHMPYTIVMDQYVEYVAPATED